MDMVPARAIEGFIENLCQDYQDLQVPVCDTFHAPPSSLEALRMISKGHPAVIKGFSPMKETHDWRSPATYTALHGDAGEVTIAVTDDGLADSVRTLPDGSSTFVKPLEEKMAMSEFLARLEAAKKREKERGQAEKKDEDAKGTEANGQQPHAEDADAEAKEEILYLQSQDGNIFRSEPGARGPPELASFQRVVARDIPWMQEATGCTAEAVNLWIGTHKSTTSFHHDPYENIYHVLSGSKTFTLVSPVEGVWFEQPFHTPSTLVRKDGRLEPVLDEGGHPVPWVEDLTPPVNVRPVKVTLDEGETLYLPSGWWHKVEQNEGEGVLAVAVNYWYTSDIRPERYAYERFVGRMARLAGLAVLPVDVDEVDDNVWASDDGDVTSADEWDPKDWGR